MYTAAVGYPPPPAPTIRTLPGGRLGWAQCLQCFPNLNSLQHHPWPLHHLKHTHRSASRIRRQYISCMPRPLGVTSFTPVSPDTPLPCRRPLGWQLLPPCHQASLTMPLNHDPNATETPGLSDSMIWWTLPWPYTDTEAHCELWLPGGLRARMAPW